jgi:hypothetical protein
LEALLDRGRVEGGGTPEPSAERVVVSFDPGLVRVGRVVAREGSALSIDFPRRQQQTIAVGSRVPIGLCGGDGARLAELPMPDRTAFVTERSEHADVRRYRLALDEDSDRKDRAVPRDRTPARGRALRVDLRFGNLDFRAEVASCPGQLIVLRVAIETEAMLRATDAIELVHCREPDDLEIRLAGWIDRRVLEGLFVRYEFRIDDQLGEDGAHQRIRLRSLLAGEESPDATQA